MSIKITDERTSRDVLLSDIPDGTYFTGIIVGWHQTPKLCVRSGVTVIPLDSAASQYFGKLVIRDYSPVNLEITIKEAKP